MTGDAIVGAIELIALIIRCGFWIILAVGLWATYQAVQRIHDVEKTLKEIRDLLGKP